VVHGLYETSSQTEFTEDRMTSLARVSGFNNVVVHTIFDALKDIVNENKITDSRIFNLQQTELTSLARVSGFNKVVVHTIFDALKDVVNENKITDSRIFNMDENSHTILQRPEKNITLEGKHVVGAIALCKRG
jgi:nitrogen regulatory protein PII